MKNPGEYRKGAVGAMMDEYERAVDELMTIVTTAGAEAYVFIADSETENEECRSIQTMVSHVVDAGYAYMNDLRPLFSMDVEPYEFALIEFAKLPGEMEKMLEYTIATLEGRWELGYAEIDEIVRVSPSGYRQDLEQLLEHAIVHVLRHRLQTEKFLIKFAAA